jgi:hypothetical protein
MITPQSIAGYIRKMKRMKIWAKENGDSQMFIELTEQIIIWRRRLRRMLYL